MEKITVKEAKSHWSKHTRKVLADWAKKLEYEFKESEERVFAEAKSSLIKVKFEFKRNEYGYIYAIQL